MQGSAQRSHSTDEPARILSRREFAKMHAVPPDMEHPLTIHVRDDAIVGDH